MQTTRAIAGRVLVAPSQGEETGVPNIVGKETTVAHIYDSRSGHSRMQAARRAPRKNAMYVGRAYNNARPT